MLHSYLITRDCSDLIGLFLVDHVSADPVRALYRTWLPQLRELTKVKPESSFSFGGQIQCIQ